jgi:hypothetical protein
MSSSGSDVLALKLTGSPGVATPGVKSKLAVGAAAITSWLPKRTPPATTTATEVFAVAKRRGANWRNMVAARLFNGEGPAPCARLARHGIRGVKPA